jgi:hypothetical protein
VGADIDPVAAGVVKKGDRYLRPEYVADMFDVPVETVTEFLRRGQLLAYRLPDGQIRIDPRSLQDFLLACELDLRKHFLEVVG